MYTKTSKHLCQVLRWKPELIGITLDKQGFTDVNTLIENYNKHNKDQISLDILEFIVKADDKKRYSFNEDKTRIRCNQGHGKNTGVDITLAVKIPPKYLYHGTAKFNIDSILKTGLLPQKRLYTHLTDSKGTAYIVGKRYAKYHNSITIIRLDTEQMIKDGLEFKISDNNVWLIEKVEPKYITFFTPEGDILDISKYITK